MSSMCHLAFIINVTYPTNETLFNKAINNHETLISPRLVKHSRQDHGVVRS